MKLKYRATRTFEPGREPDGKRDGLMVNVPDGRIWLVTHGEVIELHAPTPEMTGMVSEVMASGVMLGG